MLLFAPFTERRKPAMSKEIFMDIHDRLVEEMLEANPGMTDAEAEDKTAKAAMEKVQDCLADMADFAADRAKCP